MQEILFISVCVLMALIFFAAFIGTLLPVLPGPAIAFGAILVFKFVYPAGPVGWTFVIVAGALTLLAQVLDFALSYFGAKRCGASGWGIAGAFLGLIVGIVLSPTIIMFFAAPILGAVLGELIGGKDLKAALKAGWGTFLGTLLASLFKFGIILGMMFYFFYAVISASPSF